MFATVIPETKPTIKVSGLHAIAYCARLFYLEEVEGLYTQDAAVFAGRRLHVDLEANFCVALAKKLVWCRGEGQRKFLMRSKRGVKVPAPKLNDAISQMKRVLKQVENADNLAILLGLEGNLAALYFGALPCLLTETVPDELRFSGRNRRPPKNRFNALLSFRYSLLLKDVMNSIIAVGLESALGFYHQPRTQASPLPST